MKTAVVYWSGTGNTEAMAQAVAEGMTAAGAEAVLALYKLTVGEDVRQAFLQWERFPFSEEAEHFLESLSAYVELPSIADGYWKMVDRNPGTSAYTNVSLCVYDEATGAAYLLTMDI